MIAILFILLILLLLSNCNQKSRRKATPKNKMIRVLVRQASRWSNAAINDNNAIIAVLHSNYGAGYLWALKDIFTDYEIEDATGINIKEFQKKIVNIQDTSIKKLKNNCPRSISGLDKELTMLSSMKI